MDEKNLPSQLEAKAEKNTRDANELAEAIEILSKDAPPKIREVLQVFAQSTSGPYPPPAMLREYMNIDPKIVEHILSRADRQSSHRQELERKATEGSEKRLNRAQSHQTWVAALCVIASVSLVLITQLTGHPISWVYPSIMVAIGVGGRPVATILTRLLTLNNGVGPKKNSDDA